MISANWLNPVDKRLRLNVSFMWYDVVRRCIDVNPTSCVYWETLVKTMVSGNWHFINVNVRHQKKGFFH